MTTSPRTIRPPITDAQKAAVIATEIRVSYAGHETPEAIAKRLGITESEVFEAINFHRKPGIKKGSQAGITKWQELKSHQSTLDACPLECDKARPHKIAPGLMVCNECFELEHSDKP